MWPTDLLARAGIILAVLGGVWLYGFTVGMNRGNLKIANAQTAALQIKQKQSADLAKTINDSREKYEAAIKDLSTANTKLIAGLRSRPNRKLPDSTTPKCEGASGDQLAREDAEFLAGYATDAQQQSIKLEQCYRDNDTMRELMK